MCRRYGSNQPSGFVLWYVLACTAGLALVAAATMLTGSLTLRAEARNLRFVQCRAIASAVARSGEAVLARGGHLPALWQARVAGHPVVLTSSTSGSQVIVSIRVTEGTVSDTMSFVYDTSARVVVSWQDNGPRS